MKENCKPLSPFCERGRYKNDPSETLRGFFPRLACTLSDSWGNRFASPYVHTRYWHGYYKPKLYSVVPLVSWIGHASFLVQIGGLNILADPVFGGATFFFPRIMPPGIKLDDIPPIDIILISHNHRDHMDAKSLFLLKRFFKPNALILVPKGLKKWFDANGFNGVHEHTWWEYRRYKHGRFTFLPAHHWSQRGLFDYNRSLWGSWMIEYNGFTLYFAGDTAYANHFGAIAQKFPNIDTALLPIGPCEPDDSMRESHMGPEEACLAMDELNARSMVPMHWGTFLFGRDDFLAPVKRLSSWWKENRARFPSRRIYFPVLGQCREFKPSWQDPLLIEALGQVRPSRVANDHHDNVIGR